MREVTKRRCYRFAAAFFLGFFVPAAAFGFATAAAFFFGLAAAVAFFGAPTRGARGASAARATGALVRGFPS